MENAGLFVDNSSYDPFENDDFLKQRWLSEEQSGGRDYQVGMRAPVFMEKLGLKNVGVRINDYVDFVSSGTEAFELEQRRFIIDHGVDEKYANSNGYLAARCHVISYGHKNDV
jgi:hypothetical protein